MKKINEKVHIEKYNPQWVTYFQEEAQRIHQAISNTKYHIEHIGSTSIRKMWAKPIIDILLGVDDFPPNQKFINSIEKLGYEYMKEASHVDRLYFILRAGIDYNIHIVKFNNEIWNKDLQFRDFLRNNPNAVEEYSELKKKIYESGVDTLLEYSVKKAPFISDIISHMTEL